jgi:hypothetical protein
MSVQESMASPTPLGSDLQAGVDAISANQTVTFTKYVRTVLPSDGYVFWIKNSLLAQSPAVLSKCAPAIENTFDAKGSLHYSTDLHQEEDKTYTVNRVVFTSEREIQQLNGVNPELLYIGVFDGIRFAFGQRGSYYRQSNLFHYVGSAVYSDMELQIIESAKDLDPSNVIVSNSLPLWLTFNNYEPFYGFANLVMPLWPSFLVPSNLRPPFASVHILPESTQALSSAPRIDATQSHSQLVRESVRITMYGMNNAEALNFIDCVYQRSQDDPGFGILNMPVVRDDKRGQVELTALSQKKTVDFDISYVQSAVRDMARQYIASAVVGYKIASL